MGKGSRQRPSSITSAERDLRWELLEGKITVAVFNRRYKKLKERGLIQRNGRVMK